MENKYDPNKMYNWEPNSVFELDGKQFGTILNGLRAVMASPEAQRILSIARANDAVEEVMASATEKGIIKEIDNPPTQENAPKLEIKR